MTTSFSPIAPPSFFAFLPPYPLSPQWVAIVGTLNAAYPAPLDESWLTAAYSRLSKGMCGLRAEDSDFLWGFFDGAAHDKGSIKIVDHDAPNHR